MSEVILHEFPRLIPRGQVNPNTGVVYKSLDSAIARYIQEFGALSIETCADSCMIDGQKAVVRLSNSIGTIHSCTDTTVFVELNQQGRNWLNQGLLEDAKIQFCFLGDLKEDNVVRVVSASICREDESC